MTSAGLGSIASRALQVLLGTLATVLLVLLVTAPGELWLLEHHTLPHWLAVPFVLGYLGVAFRMPGRAGDVVLAAILTGMYATFTVFPLGDHMRWMVVAGTDNLFRSEILGNLTFREVYVAFGPDALRWIAPAFGFAATLAYLAVCRTWFGNDRGDERLARVYYLAAATQLVFFANYVENTQLAVPFLLVYMLALHRHLRTPGMASLVVVAVSLAAACLVHGQNLFLTPSLPIAILVAGAGQRPGGVLARESALSAVIVVATIAAVWFALQGLGFNHVGGHERMPFPPSNTFGTDRFGWFSHVHWVELANITLLASPVTFAAPVLAFLFLRGARATDDRAWVLTLIGLGYFAFIFIWSFDFGFPVDYDLMLSMSVPWGLAMLAWLLALARSSARGRTAAWVLVSVGGVMIWSVFWSFADRYDPRDVGSDAPRAELQVSGRSGGPDSAPVEMKLSASQQLRVVLRGKPDATFFLLTGPRHPGNFVSATIGTLDLGTPPSFRDVTKVHEGTLDAEGRFEITLPVPGNVNLQALFPEEPGGRYLSRLTTAFYVTVE